jgi:hypothetical protein
LSGIAEYLISNKYTNNIEEVNALIHGLKACNSPYVTRPLVVTLPETVVSISAKREVAVKVRVSNTSPFHFSISTLIHLISDTNKQPKKGLMCKMSQ